MLTAYNLPEKYSLEKIKLPNDKTAFIVNDLDTQREIEPGASEKILFLYNKKLFTTTFNSSCSHICSLEQTILDRVKLGSDMEQIESIKKKVNIIQNTLNEDDGTTEGQRTRKKTTCVVL